MIGLVLASAFSAILVFGQELVPGNVGLISGLFFGLAFGLAGVGAALLGALADHTSIAFVYRVCVVPAHPGHPHRLPARVPGGLGASLGA